MRWYVVQTHTHGEHKAALHLKRQKFDVYLPQYLKRWRHARKTEMRPAPLFPRYLFVSMDVGRARWRAIRSTIGVSSLICNGDQPAVLPDAVVDDIRAREDEKGLQPLQASLPFKKGDRLSVIEGSLAGAQGFFECFHDRDRVVLLLELLGRPMRLQVPANALTAAP